MKIDFLEATLIGVFVLCVAAVAFCVHMAASAPPKEYHSLPVTEWTCTGTKPEAVTTYIQTGKVLTPITTYHDECIEYKRKY